MTELPVEVRDRAARAALEAFHVPRHPMYTFETTTEGYREAWREVVDAVARVLAEHPGHWLGQRSIMQMENEMLQARVGKLRVALECYSDQPSGSFVAKRALAADDRAAGRTEEEK